MNYASKNLKHLIAVLGVSQASLEPVVGKKQQTISNWLNGKYDMDAEDLVRLSDHFGLTLEDMCLIDLSKGNLITDAYIARFRQFGNLKGNPIGNLKDVFHKINGEFTEGNLPGKEGVDVSIWMIMKLLQQMDEKIDQIKLSVEQKDKK